MNRTLPLIMGKPRWDVKMRWSQSQGRAHLYSAAEFSLSNVWVFLFLAWPPVCRVQHEVPLRRCEEAERHPTGRLEDGRLRLHQQFRTEGFAADRDENVAQEGLVDERAGTRTQSTGYFVPRRKSSLRTRTMQRRHMSSTRCSS